MILVSFRGYGEWFYRESDNIRLAIKRTTNKPYRKPSYFGLKDIYCPDYDDWLGGFDNTDEKFSEWVELFEDSRKEIAEENYKSEDHEYNFDLRGIFVRDPNAKGDVYDTDRLRCFGANYIDCQFIQGVFKLNDDDEEACRLFSFESIKDEIKILLPCSHDNSAFIKKVSEGKLLSNDAHRYYFEIQDLHHRDFPRSSNPRAYKYHLKLESEVIKSEELISIEDTSENNTDPKKKASLTGINLERIKDLKSFRNELITALNIKNPDNKIDLASPKPFFIPCKKETILEALKKWSKREGRKKPDCIWQSLEKEMDRTLWASPERKAILTSLSEGKNEKDPYFIEKLIF